MNTIVETELRDMARKGEIKRMNIVQSENGTYRIFCNLTWKEGDWHLITTRKVIREWASLDRLIRHVLTDYGHINHVRLLLYPSPLATEKDQ